MFYLDKLEFNNIREKLANFYLYYIWKGISFKFRT